MQNDSIDTLLLRHYGSAAPAPVDLEQQLSALVRQESAAQVSSRWNQRRVSRRRVLQLMTFGSAGLGALAVGINALQGSPKRPAYAV